MGIFLRFLAVLGLMLSLAMGVIAPRVATASCLEALVQSQVEADFQFVISGAGPAGLTQALQLIQAGVPAQEILVLEKRSPEDLRGHGSRTRIVTLDSYADDVLKSLGVWLQGSELDAIHFVHGREHHLLRLNGAQSALIENLMGRRVVRTITLGDLEKALLKVAREKGIEVRFSTQAQQWSHEDGKVHFHLGARDQKNALHLTEVTAGFGLIAEGKKSAARDAFRVAYQPFSLGENPRYLGYDFSIPETLRNPAGSFYNFFDEQGAIIGFLFAAGEHGSLTIYAADSLDIGDQFQMRKYQAFMSKMIAAAGFGPHLVDRESIFQFDGSLSYSEQVRVQQTFFTGDSARSTDPAAGNGVNTAIAFDSVAVREFASELSKVDVRAPGAADSKEAALRKLSRALSRHSQYTLEMSVWIQNVMQWIYKHWSFSETMMGMIEAAPLLPESVTSPFHPFEFRNDRALLAKHDLKSALAKKIGFIRKAAIAFTPFNPIGKEILARTNRLGEPLARNVLFEEALSYGKSVLNVPLPPENPRGIKP